MPTQKSAASREVHKPTREEVRRAAGRTIADVVAPKLAVLFCGINPGLYSAAIGCHFARPGNRFWRALHEGGFTSRILTPVEQHTLPAEGWGVTNLVARATASADELRRDELVAGRAVLERKIRKFRPRWLGVLGVGAYRLAFARPHAAIGPQPDALAGALVWVLPNPSGLNAHYQPIDLAREFRRFHRAVTRSR
jgi:TDG/mug DNA glycosylase family protein